MTVETLFVELNAERVVDASRSPGSCRQTDLHTRTRASDAQAIRAMRAVAHIGHRVVAPMTHPLIPANASAADRPATAACYLSAPLRLGEDHIGALHLYSVDGHGFSDLDAALLKIYTAVGETIIGLSLDLERHSTTCPA